MKNRILWIIASVLMLTNILTAASIPKTIKVAMCQIVSLDGDREGNFVRIENALRDASKLKADIACFPESSILGWVNPDAHQRAFPIPGNDTERLCDLARTYKIYICTGLDEKDGDKLYDAAVLIDDTGKLLLTHHKINNLSDVKDLMVPNYTDGDHVDAVDTKFGKIGLLICADTFDEKNLHNLAALKPALVLVPYGWANSETAWPKHGDGLAKVVSHAAVLTGASVVGVDSIGQISHGAWAGSYYGGASVAFDAHGQKIGAAADRDRDVKVIKVPSGNIHSFNKSTQPRPQLQWKDEIINFKGTDWSPYISSQEDQIKVFGINGTPGSNALGLQYAFKTNRINFFGLAKKTLRPISITEPFVFSVRGDPVLLKIEFKLIDDSDAVFLKSIENVEISDHWQKFTFNAAEIPYAWGNGTDASPQMKTIIRTEVTFVTYDKCDGRIELRMPKLKEEE